MTNHTPGPWSVLTPDEAFRQLAQYGEYDEDALEVVAQDGDIDDDPWFIATCWSIGELETNARLIAAAPDLLAACETALVFCETAAKEVIDADYERLVVEPLRQAIDRAKGEGQ